MSLLAFAFVFACVASPIAKLSVDRASGTPDLLRVGDLLPVALIGSLLMAGSMIYQFGSQPIDLRLALAVCLAGLLLISAQIDRLSAWSPDLVILPILAASVLISPWASSTTFSTLLSLAGIFAAAQLLWLLQIIINVRFIQPSDLIALALPWLIFSDLVTILAIQIVTCVALVLASGSDRVASLFSKQAAVQDATQDTGIADEKSGITFLSVIFPIIWGFLLFEAV